MRGAKIRGLRNKAYISLLEVKKVMNPQKGDERAIYPPDVSISDVLCMDLFQREFCVGMGNGG